MIFNLKNMIKEAKKPHDSNSYMLQKEHKDAPNEITEKQLDEYRDGEKEVSIEKLLDNKRLGSTDFTIIEKSLNDSKSNLMKHRNPSAYEGDINKLEEKRINTYKVEDEIYEPETKVNSNKKWWSHLAKEKKNVTAQVQPLNFEEEHWDMVEDEDEQYEDAYSALEDIVGTEDDLTSVTEDDLTLNYVKPSYNDVGNGLVISFDVNPNTNKSLSELQKEAYDLIINSENSHLENTDFSPENFKMSAAGDRLVARLFGDEYLNKDNKSEDDFDINDFSEDIDTPEPTTENFDIDVSKDMFTVENVGETGIDDVLFGEVAVNPDNIDLVRNMDEDEIRNKVQEIVQNQVEGLVIEPDGINLEDLDNGLIGFLGRKEDVSLASNNFDIVVLSSKKKM